MKKLILTSPKYAGQITFGYSDTGQLLYYHNESDLDHTKNEWLLPNLPIYETNLKVLTKQLHGTLIEVPKDISFEAFWAEYDRKINRKRSEPIYLKYGPEDQTLAIVRAKPYQKYRQSKAQAVADPEKYLRDRLFDTDWSKLK